MGRGDKRKSMKMRRRKRQEKLKERIKRAALAAGKLRGASPKKKKKK